MAVEVKSVLCLRLLVDMGRRTSILQMGGVGPREVKPCVQGHTARKQHVELGLSYSRMGSYLDPLLPPALGTGGLLLSALTLHWVGQVSPPVQQTLSPCQVRHAEA